MFQRDDELAKDLGCVGGAAAGRPEEGRTRRGGDQCPYRSRAGELRFTGTKSTIGALRLSLDGPARGESARLTTRPLHRYPRPPGGRARGRETFAAAFRSLGTIRLESIGEIREIQIADGWAYCWSYLSVKMSSATDGADSVRSGNTLSVLRKRSNGAWEVSRDANLSTPDATSGNSDENPH
jgi:ketosteroid isomerase-like protein